LDPVFHSEKHDNVLPKENNNLKQFHQKLTLSSESCKRILAAAQQPATILFES
jgi:hypothetical protein